MDKRSIPINDSSDNGEDNKDTGAESNDQKDKSIVNEKAAASAYKQQAGDEQSASSDEKDAKEEETAGEEPEAEDTPSQDPAETPEGPREMATEPPLEEQMAEMKDRMMRQAAEFDNFRKRTQRERTEIVNRATARLMEDLLPLLDNFKLALQQANADAEDPFFKGVKLIYKQVEETLKKHGLAPIQADGEHFNPEVHEALMSEATDEYPEDTVIQVLQDGYTLNGRVLRPARVKVAKPAE